jgi:hypothetical protein
MKLPSNFGIQDKCLYRGAWRLTSKEGDDNQGVCTVLHRPLERPTAVLCPPPLRPIQRVITTSFCGLFSQLVSKLGQLDEFFNSFQRVLWGICERF